MSDVSKDSSPDILETHRVRLEESVQKLRKALQRWQEYSAEYEGLQEELHALPQNATRDDMLAIAKDFGGNIVTEKEILSFLGDKEKVTRTAPQVADAVKHRIDYVQINITTVQKQLDQGEQRLTSVDVLLQPDQVTNEEGLPLMEIREEVDEDGNEIISSKPGANTQVVPMSLDGLKAFQPYVNELDEKDTSKSTSEKGSAAPLINSIPSSSEQPPSNAILVALPPQTAQAKPTSSSTIPISKSVPQLVNDPDGGIATIKVSNDTRDEQDEHEVDEEFTNAPEVEEDEEAARLRRDMIRYNLNEIGAVVAEIELEEEDEAYESDEEGIYDDEDFEAEAIEDGDEDDDEEEEEDEYGRSRGRLVSAKLQREMQMLQDKVQAREELRKKQEIERANKKEEEEVKAALISNGGASQVKGKKLAKKGVRFARELDIAPAPERKASIDEDDDAPIDTSILDMVFGPGTKDAEDKLYHTAPEVPKEKGPSLFKSARMTEKGANMSTPRNDTPQPAGLMNEIVLERPPVSSLNSSKAPTAPQPPQPPQKISRFKASKATTIAPTTSIIQSRPLQPIPYAEPDISPAQPLSNIIERPSSSAPPKAPSDLDPDLHRQEVAMQYHRMKNQFIQRQGGYGETEEEKQFVPLDQDGEVRKMSRFKAGLVRKQPGFS